jgi:hypothetical protein
LRKFFAPVFPLQSVPLGFVPLLIERKSDIQRFIDSPLHRRENSTYPWSRA